MCGIVGYVGNNEAVPTLLDGLSKVQYRGYDSAGIAVIEQGGKLSICKRAGKLSTLKEAVGRECIAGHIGIGHTRWATHGVPNDINAHPHTDCTGRIAVVHNGTIENYAQLREALRGRGHRFVSETDTEVMPHLIEEEYIGVSFAEAVRRALQHVRGAYAIVGLSCDEPDVLVGARQLSPLIVGLGEGKNYLASDIPAILDKTREVLFIEDREMVVLTRESTVIYSLDSKKPVSRMPFHVEWDMAAAEKGGHPYFTLKEILEQPQTLRNALSGRLLDGSEIVSLPELASIDLGRVDRIYVVGCSTSYYAGLLGKLAIEAWTRIPVEAVIASEFRYTMPILNERTLCIFISQSGETADVLVSSRLARECGAQTLALCNVVGSSLTRNVDATLYLQVGPEISVIATKSFTAQVLIQYLLALQLGLRRGTIDQKTTREMLFALQAVPSQVEAILVQEQAIAELAHGYIDRRGLFFIGRVYGCPVAFEGAMKFKEITYIHAEGVPAGELKHGHLAVVDSTVPVVALAYNSPTYEKVVSNMQEVRARGAEVIAIATDGNGGVHQYADRILYIPSALEPVSALLSVVPLQLFAYHAAVALGLNPDTPRNLAKSVTVE